MAHFVYSPLPQNKGINMDVVASVEKGKKDLDTNKFKIYFKSSTAPYLVGVWEYSTKPKRDSAFTSLRNAMQALYPGGNSIS